MARSLLKRFTSAAIDVAYYATVGGLPGGAVLGAVLRTPLDERLAKIEEAKRNLAEALTAIEELEGQAQENSRSLAVLTAKLDDAEKTKSLVQEDIDTLREAAKLDANGLRKGLGIPGPVGQVVALVISFCLGVAASLTANYLWQFTPWG
jgi:hypothetical protein